jgi:pyruvate dehydrogenase E1 component alpha subunit
MPKKILETFQVEYLQVMDENGNVDPALDPKLPADDLKKLYRTMLLARMVDDRMYKLQAQGRMGTFPGVRGQEACVGGVYPMKPTDWLQPSFRESACLFWRGVAPKRWLEFYAGMEEGNVFPEESRTLPIPISVGAQTLHATGWAWAEQIKGTSNVTLCYMGDGATSEGDFHESLNMAGVFKLPVVYIVMDNQFAISVPRTTQSASKTLAQKAIAYGFPGIQVDGNDVLSAVVASTSALDRARAGQGPTLIEMVTYRLGPHTTADDARRYRSEEEVKAWLPKEPLVRLRKYLEKKKLWDHATQAATEAEFTQQIEKEVQEYEAELAAADPMDIFEYVYAAKTPDLALQKEKAKQFADSYKGHH